MTTTEYETAAPLQEPPAAKSVTSGRRGTPAHVTVYIFILVPLLALAAAVPVAWGWGLGWRDVILAVVFYEISGLGVTIGYHRYFTHRSFKAKPWFRVLLALCGSLAVQGGIVHWVADHRRHHAFSDKEGDPHSPWRFGTAPGAVAKGFLFAHMGWLLERDETNAERFAPDLMADRTIVRIDKMFALWLTISLLAPAAIGGAASASWQGAASAFFWAGLVRVGILQHITWSTNSVCHMVGERPFNSRDHATNVWPLALLSFGESWHNMHHADPTSARHGALRGQLDESARLIWIFEKFGWVRDVRWPSRQRIERLLARPAPG